ncbi:MAG TPA: hypothetical protein VF600_04215 [Abditibacteriaceae bacterium]
MVSTPALRVLTSAPRGGVTSITMCDIKYGVQRPSGNSTTPNGQLSGV